MKKLCSFLFLIACFVAVSQGIDQQKVDYVHSFANNIGWPENKEEYVLKVITQDHSLTQTFKEMAATRQINGKPTRVSFSSHVSIPERLDILYVSSQYNGALQIIIDSITGKSVLIITEQSSDQQYIMVNLIGTPLEMSFEFNRANIINQNLQLDDDFNELGGNEINIAALYRQPRDSARAMEERSKVVKERIDSLNVNMAIAFKIANDQNEQIAKGREQLDRQNKILDSLTIALRDREEELAILEDEIIAQEGNLKKGRERLNQQAALIKQRNKEIGDKEKRINRMITIVDSQKYTLILLIVFLVFLVAALILAYRAYHARRRDARKLGEQKEELKDLLEELKSTQTQLIQSEKMASLGTLTAGIAHEINNAINYVHSGVHVLSNKFSEIKPIIGHVKDLNENDEHLKAKVKKIRDQKNELEYDSYESVIDTMINSIQVGAERTISVVKGLRTFSRAQEESRSEIDIHEDIEVALLFLKNKIRPTLSIEKDLADELPTIFGYPGQVGQAILNIIGNAMDACGNEPGSVVSIKTRVENDKATISIKDNGIGIKQEDLDKIFDPFYTTKKIGEGSGLGLSITYGIIEKHGGTIDVNSVLGEETEFKIKLPLNDQLLN
ncbi:MAG: YfiR/HmsC family protein [Bacteroidota bacterium]